MTLTQRRRALMGASNKIETYDLSDLALWFNNISTTLKESSAVGTSFNDMVVYFSSRVALNSVYQMRSGTKISFNGVLYLWLVFFDENGKYTRWTSKAWEQSSFTIEENHFMKMAGGLDWTENKYFSICAKAAARPINLSLIPEAAIRVEV
jgi:hypothetical protein